MRKVTIISLVSMLLIGGLALAGKQGNKAASSADRIRHQIAAKMLYDGLKLTPQQKTALSAKLDEARAAKEAHRENRPGENPELIAALTTARDEVYANGQISDATRQKLQQIHEANAQAIQAARQAGQPDFKGDIEKILTPEQVDYFKKFNPMRELGFGHQGEGDVQGKGERPAGGMPPIVDRLRTMSDEDYTAKKQQLLDRMKKHLEAQGDQDIQSKVDKVSSQLDIVRNGTPEDIEKLKADFALPMLMGDAAQRGARVQRELEMRVKLLLSPEFQALLQGKDPRTLQIADGGQS